MPAILPSLTIDAPDKKLSRYFLPYQLCWIHDPSPLCLAEKSVRIGWTFADALKNVRKRLLHKNRDYLFATKDEASAVEYMRTVQKHAELFNFTKYIVSRGQDRERISGTLANGEKFTVEMKFNYVKFENGSRILAFSSNPYAMAVFGGDVGLDEFAKHQNAEKLWETAQGRAAWGHDLSVWSAHDGTDTLFYQFAQEARNGTGGWSYYRVTMTDAVELGLVEKINAVRGTQTTREEFMANCRNRARQPEIFEQAYNCNPCGSTSGIVAWNQIQLCQQDYAIPRLHLESAQIAEAFGPFTPATQAARERRIADFIISAFSTPAPPRRGGDGPSPQALPPLFSTPGQYRLGFDVAASGEGDLACIYIDKKEPPRLRLAALFTCRTDDWNFLKTVLWTFHRRLPGVRSAGDETGLGRQICWETAKTFPGQFTPVNFASEKHNLGFTLMNQLSVAEKIFPKGEPDVAQDFFSLRKLYAGKTWKFTEGRNLLNPASHGDIAWAGALASHAAEKTAPPVAFARIETNRPTPNFRSAWGVGKSFGRSIPL